MPKADIKLNDDQILSTAQSVAASITQAAQPGQGPVATGASPIDAAAAAVAGAVQSNIAASSAQLAPRSADGLAKAQAAMAQMKEQDSQNADRIKAVPADLQPSDRPSGASPVQAVSADPDDWFEGDNWHDRNALNPEPLMPSGAGVGPDFVGGGLAPVSYSPEDEFDWNDFTEGGFEPVPLGPEGAGPGPSVGGGLAPVSYSPEDDAVPVDDWGFFVPYVPPTVDPGGAGTGPDFTGGRAPV